VLEQAGVPVAALEVADAAFAADAVTGQPLARAPRNGLLAAADNLRRVGKLKRAAPAHDRARSAPEGLTAAFAEGRYSLTTLGRRGHLLSADDERDAREVSTAAALSVRSSARVPAASPAERMASA
jgi:hypothetical protein